MGVTPRRVLGVYQGTLMSSAKDANQKAGREVFDLRISAVPGMNIAAERGERLVGLAADEDPELGFIGILGLKDVVRACEEYQVASARAAGWTWAQIAIAIEVSPQAAHQRHAARLAAGQDQAR